MQSDVIALKTSSATALEVYKSAMEAAGVGFTIGDAARPGFPLIYANPAFENMTGYRSEEIIGQNCRFLQGDDHDQPGLTLVRQALREGTGCTVILRNYRKDGTLFWNQLSLTPVRDTQGHLTHFVAIQTDVSELKRAQEEALKAELMRVELEKEREIIALKENFTSMVSHEFRAPLTVISTSVDLLDHFADRMTPEKRQRHLQNIRAQALYMRGLLDDVLLYSKVKAGKTDFHPRPLNLDTFCRHLIEQLQATDPASHPIALTLSGALDQAVMDEKLLQHILVNLVSNALKYSPANTRVGFEATVEKGSIVFLVSDEGIGIPEADQAHLFEPFHRAQNAHDIEGTGLGLAIVKSSVELHGGEIACHSVVGQGTTFTVRLPLVSAAD